ncbi:MBL fold metallo-hydrolase [Desulfatitalea alkaliphila]|uniref:MBL fold metallo-hydrolase n=1 Tax=Desulfatitalea alkaliphila TaxID=2929485 RepID=A0AA41QZP6_9BACT|nr:MBL fold metallo-hydrolase [Desulfatitalea alkaliphila]MCJ8499353.1 MBL fold metallo-hydrolase [Desulfatitalea alkaliphila]
METPLHYQPLNGMTLRRIAAERIHHGHNGRFLNPLGERRRRANLGRVLYWKLFHENPFEPHLAEQPVVPVRIDWRAVKKHDGVSVTFLKHASVLIKDGERHMIVDPVFDDSLFWFIKDFTPLDFDLAEMPRVDDILITHGHYDHLSRPALARFDRDTHVISPLGYDGFFNSLGMQRRHPLDWFDSYADDRRRITFLPCNHWTMRNPITGPNRSLWGAYVVETAGGKTIYISGDTAFFDGFDQIGRQFDIDLAIFNLGAYEPRWFMAPSHMNPEETVTAFKQLGARQLMAIHWGTYRLGDEPVHFPPLQLRSVMAREGLLDRLVEVRHGQTVHLT